MHIDMWWKCNMNELRKRFYKQHKDASDDTVHKQEPVNKHRFFSKKLGTLTVLFVVGILVTSLVSAVLIMQFFNGTQDKNASTPGTTEPLALELWYKDSRSENASVNLGNMINLDIPLYWGTTEYPINNGETKLTYYYLKNTNTHTYKYVINCTVPWADDPDNEYYGYNYGVYNYSGCNLNGIEFTVSPSTTSDCFILLQSCDPYYKTPTNGTSPIHWTIESWIVS